MSDNMAEGSHAIKSLCLESVQILKRPEFFGQYGKVVHMVVNKSQGYNR